LKFEKFGLGSEVVRTILSVIAALIFGAAAKAETIRLDRLTFSDVIAVGAANGLAADEIAKIIDEFEGKTTFESKRLRDSAVSKILEAAEKIRAEGPPLVEFEYMAPISQFDFDSGTFALCMPVRVGIVEDIPLKDPLSLYTAVGAFETAPGLAGSKYRSRAGHPRNLGDDFIWVCKNGEILENGQFEYKAIKVGDVSRSEEFDSMVEVGGGFVTARVRCLLETFSMKPDIDRFQLRATCRPKEMSLFSVSDTNFANPELEAIFD
jgi:hypothetical protein